MPEPHPWSIKLKELRDKKNIAQNVFQDDISRRLVKLSESEIEQLRGINLYDDLIRFTNSNATLMGHYEGVLRYAPDEIPLPNARRPPATRARHLSIIWGFHKIGAFQSIEEANELLGLVGFASLSVQECEVIFGETYTEVVAPNEKDIAKPPKRKSPIPLIAAGALAIVVAIAGFLLWPRESLPSPWFYDDFSSPSINGEEWIVPEDTRLYTEDGKLVFDLLFDPAKYDSSDPNSDDWQEQTLDHKHVNNFLDFSHIKFSAVLNTPKENGSGSFGVQTHCNGNQQEDERGVLNVYLGGQGRQLTATYVYDSDASTDEEKVVPLMGLEGGKLYTIDMVWSDEGLEISVDGEKKTDEPIPCPAPQYFNINGGVASDLPSLKGYIDEIWVWD